jgi:hypothetical protein
VVLVGESERRVVERSEREERERERERSLTHVIGV